jgi:DNA repair protein RadC
MPRTPAVRPDSWSRVTIEGTAYRVCLVREDAPTRASDRPVISTPEEVRAFCADLATITDREHFHALLLDTKNRLIERVEVSIGSLAASLVHPRELYRAAVLASAASVVVVHNHPSGDPTPSSADLQLTRRLVRAGEVLGIELVDHVVIGDGDAFASVREMGCM